ncbi:11084_t:CDS:2 [Racocetra persica]|uniref:11084_t:CDS:1 n=1 Tax=Racocetra persica TaxID=160502 RepID=A0ACA9MCI3_9GLOM|nr:11084_t:CDS:2 [Racocetra persica]
MLSQRKIYPDSKSSDETNETTSLISGIFKNNKCDSDNLKKTLLCNFGELPLWLQDNCDILRGYRRPTFSYLKCAESLFYVHNESALANKFRTPEFRWFRTGLFISMGLSAIIPLIHALIIYGVELSVNVISLNWMVVMGAFYITGALIYGARIPERWFPGKFDIYGSSHQIFHFFVVAAAFVHYFGVMQAMMYWHDKNHNCELDITMLTPSFIY